MQPRNRYATDMTAQAPRQSAWVASKRAKRDKDPWETAVALAAVLVIACWIAYGDPRHASPLGASTLQGSNALVQQMPFVPA